MFSRSLLVAGLFFQMSLLLEAQIPYGGPGQPSRRQVEAWQRQNMQQGMQQGMQGQGMQGQGMQGQGMQGVPFEATGTIDTIGAGQVKIIDDKGTERLVHYNQQTVVKTSGEATPEFLKPGLVVEFKTEVDAKGFVPGKVGELTIVSVSKERPSGIFPEGGDADTKADAKADTKAGAKSSVKSAAKPATASKAKKGGTLPTVMSKVVGTIKSAKNGKLQVQAGRTSVQCDLSESPKISIDTNDGNFAIKGDKIEVKGMAMPNTPNVGQAQSIMITLAEPLGLSKKKNEPAKFDSKRATKASKSKLPSGLPAPAEDK
jgi:hypothetical protein